jgi:hypothetical protein
MSKTNRKVLFWLMFLALGVVVSALVVAGEEMTITGVVQAADWDDEDNVIAVTILADGEEYFVENNAKGKELLEQVGKSVRATGMVETDEDGFRSITVSSFEILE